MAALRRSKNYATEAQTPMFLYTILKQLDLRSIDWNAVAEKLDISNGHAARMRYSRMRSQFEGVSAQSRPSRPKKEKPASIPPPRDKGRGKRQLLEEENERLAKAKSSHDETDQQLRLEKRVKFEPSLELDSPWPPVMPTSNEQFNWMPPSIKLEPHVNANRLNTMVYPTYQAPIKREPQQFPSAFSGFVPAIKKEEFGSAAVDALSAVAVQTIKTEPGMAAFNKFYPDNLYVRTPGPAFPPLQQRPIAGFQSSGCSPSYSNALTGTPGFNNQELVGDHFFNPQASAYGGGNLMLSPLARSFEDLLEMPVHATETSVADFESTDATQTNVPAIAEAGAQKLQDGAGTAIDTSLDTRVASPVDVDGLDPLLVPPVGTQSPVVADFGAASGDLMKNTGNEAKFDGQGLEQKPENTVDADGSDLALHPSGGEAVLIKREIVEIDD